MENNATVSQTPSLQAQPVTPVMPQAPIQPTANQTPNMVPSNGGMGKKVLLVLVLVILFAGVLGGGYYLYQNSTSSKTQNANVYIQPTTAVSPTPQVYQSNPSDTSNQAITSDAQAAGQNLNNLDASLNSVDQGLADQQTNLQ